MSGETISVVLYPVWPLARLLLGMCCGLLIANLLEAMGWTDHLAKLAAPLSRAAHLNPVAASAFALAFVSPSAANATLSQKFSANELTFPQLMLANLFNGLPAYMAHTPTIFLLMWPVLGWAAITYVSVTLAAAIGRTAFTIMLGRCLFRAPSSYEAASQPLRKFSWSAAWPKAWRRFRKRLPKLLYFTIPMYILMYLGQESGFFNAVERWLSQHLNWLTFLNPQAVGIILMQLLAEMGATLGAASAALQEGGLTTDEVVIAMLVGNVIATPLRAIRHQLPAYAGFFSPGIALRLIIANQGLRAASMILMIFGYILLIR